MQGGGLRQLKTDDSGQTYQNKLYICMRFSMTI